MEGAKGSGLSELELAIETMVAFYSKYSSIGWWPKKEGIQEPSFKKMLKRELNHMLTNTKNKKAVDELIRNLDQNGDKVIDFDEYWNLIEAIVLPLSCIKE